jgi:ATP-dependent DNA helicase DinG
LKPLKEHYPFPAFRPGVEELLDALDSSEQKKYFIIRGRTGSGKSAISVALSRKYEAHILTATKLLQDQYSGTPVFNAEFVLKGKSNYSCTISGGSMSDAPCGSRKLLQLGKAKYSLPENTQAELRQACAKNNRCEYYQKKYALPHTAGGILNYDLAFSSAFTGKAIILDEAHNFIDKVLDFYSLEIPVKRIVSLLKIKDLPNQTNYADWLKRVRGAAAIRAEVSSDAKTIEQCKQIADRVSAILQEARLPGDFYVDSENEKVQIKPIYPHSIAHKFLSRFEKIFFLSATIDAKFAEVLGLEPERTAEFNLESSFPLENRPIYFPKDIPTINYSTKFDRSLPCIQLLDSILERHQGQRGIIHTSNYRVFNALQLMYGTNKRFTWVEQGANKSLALSAHRAQPDSVLVSPSMMEGVDLAGDLGRFQVILKLPFPARSDYMEALNNAMPGIYEMATRNALVQAYGRAVRSDDDWAHTYVLDGSLRFMLESIDSYFAKAVRMGSWEKLKGALQSGAIGQDIKAKQEK